MTRRRTATWVFVFLMTIVMAASADFCTQCGREVGAADLFCAKCGTKIAGRQPQPPIPDVSGAVPASAATVPTNPPPSVPAGMVLIPAGSFTMGDHFNDGRPDELPLHTVSISAFCMDRYEVTKMLWDEIATWARNHDYNFDNSGSGKADNHPVHAVNWFDVVKWCNARSEKEGCTPVYYTDPGFTEILRKEHAAPSVNWSATGYRLPTEAEWEYAARGRANGRRFPWSDTDTIQHTRANYFSRVSRDTRSYDTSPTRGFHPSYKTGSVPYTSPVGSFAPNGYGLFDMAGNVYEWCWDWHDPKYYRSSPPMDPRGPASGTSHVLRGGGWSDYGFDGDWRVAARFHSGYPVYRLYVIGLRTVRSPPAGLDMTAIPGTPESDVRRIEPGSYVRRPIPVNRRQRVP